MKGSEPEKPGQWKRVGRSRHVESIEKHCNVVTIEEDLRPLFPSEKAVNDALRPLIPVLEQAGMEPDTVSPQIPFTREACERQPGYEAPKRTVVIHNDVTIWFRNAAEVNDALRHIAAFRRAQAVEAK